MPKLPKCYHWFSGVFLVVFEITWISMVVYSLQPIRQIVAFGSTRHEERWQSVSSEPMGIIDSINRRQRHYIGYRGRFRYNDREVKFQCFSSSDGPSYQKGEPVPIEIYANNVRYARIKGTSLSTDPGKALFIFMIFGGVWCFFVIVTVRGFWRIYQKKKRKSRRQYEQQGSGISSGFQQNIIGTGYKKRGKRKGKKVRSLSERGNRFTGSAREPLSPKKDRAPTAFFVILYSWLIIISIYIIACCPNFIFVLVFPWLFSGFFTMAGLLPRQTFQNDESRKKAYQNYWLGLTFFGLFTIVFIVSLRPDRAVTELPLLQSCWTTSEPAEWVKITKRTEKEQNETTWYDCEFHYKINGSTRERTGRCFVEKALAPSEGDQLRLQRFAGLPFVTRPVGTSFSCDWQEALLFCLLLIGIVPTFFYIAYRHPGR